MVYQLILSEYQGVNQRLLLTLLSTPLQLIVEYQGVNLRLLEGSQVSDIKINLDI